MKKNKDIWIIGSIISVILFIVIFIQLKCTKFVYYWDFVGYYENCLAVIWHFGQSILLGIKKVIYTIFYDDYNYLAAILPSIPMAIFGQNRTIYTLGITVLYYIPFIFLYLTLIKPLLKDTKYKNIWLIVSLLPCMPFLIYLNYMGYVDICGLNVIMLIYLITKNKENKYKNFCITGCLLMLLYFLRRWYIFYVIAYLITVFIFDLKDFIKDKEKKTAFIKYLKKYLVIGGVMLGIVILTCIINIILFKNDNTFKIQWSNFYIIKLLFVNYSDLYSAYSRPLSSDLLAIGTKFGYIIIAIAIFSIIISIKNRKNLKQVLFFTIQMILCFALFEHTQSHDIHHFLLYVVNLMLIITYLFQNSSKLYIKIIVATILVINLIISIPFCYNNPIVKTLKKYYITNSIDLNVLYRDDMEEFEAVNNKINELSEDGTKKIYINASSSIINDSMIYSYDKTIGTNYITKDYLLQVSHVDSRDGIPTTIKDADIIMVTSPDQKHMVDQNQKIISYINEIFLKEEKSNAFTRDFELKEQINIGDVKLYFYSRIDTTSDEEYNEFVQKAEEYMESYEK